MSHVVHVIVVHNNAVSAKQTIINREPDKLVLVDFGRTISRLLIEESLIGIIYKLQNLILINRLVSIRNILRIIPKLTAQTIEATLNVQLIRLAIIFLVNSLLEPSTGIPRKRVTSFWT